VPWLPKSSSHQKRALLRAFCKRLFCPTCEASQPNRGARPQGEDKDSNQGSQSTHNGIGLEIAALCVPSMGTLQPMDKNRVEGRHGTTSWHNTAKPSGVPVEVNAAAVRRSDAPLPGEICPPSVGQKSAEVIVVGERAGVRSSTSK